MIRSASEQRLDRWERDSMRRKIDEALHAAARRAGSSGDDEEGLDEPSPPSALTYVLNSWLLQLERRTFELEWQNRQFEDRSRRWRAAFMTVSIVAIIVILLTALSVPSAIWKASNETSATAATRVSDR
jgi:hypothetical protein